MIAGVAERMRAIWEPYSRRPFPTLLRVFIGRVFHGGGDSSASELDVSLGVILVFLAMPGVLVSVLLFEKYSTLLRWMRREGSFDPFLSTIPDEYFFIVLSMVVAGAAAVWRWDALFLDRRDYTNIVPLPISLRRIFLGNFAAILFLAGTLTLDVNAGSFVLFPIVVTGSQDSLSLFIRFGMGHASAVILASAFSFFAVFAVIGLLMAMLPYGLFRRVSLYVRFVIALFFLALLATSLAVSPLLAHTVRASKLPVHFLPPVWFLGFCETLWGNGANPFFAAMTRTALLALGIAVAVAVLSYALAFRRSFIRIPETAEIGPLPRSQFRFFPLSFLERTILRKPAQRACFHFITRTLLRSESHLQIVSASLALGVVLSVQSITSAVHAHIASAVHFPDEELLAIPFVLAFCIIVGIRIAFEVPSDLRANWIFALLIDPNALETRPIARKTLLVFSLLPLAALCFGASWFLWGIGPAIQHTAIFCGCTISFVELLLARFRKIPFTCTYPAFKSTSTLTCVAYFFGFMVFTIYLPQLDLWSLAEPWRAAVFLPFIAIVFLSVQQYRKQMLDMDKQLIFEESSASSF